MNVNRIRLILPHILVQAIVIILITRASIFFMFFKLSQPAGWLMTAGFIVFNIPVLWSFIIWAENSRTHNRFTKECLIVVFGVLAACCFQAVELFLHYKIINYPLPPYLIKDSLINSLLYIPLVLITGELIRNHNRIWEKISG